MLEVRKKLPSYEMRDEILNTINSNQVVVLSGETGETILIILLPFLFLFYKLRIMNMG